MAPKRLRILKPVVIKEWTITPWTMNGAGGWKMQPIILVEGDTPFFADHPTAYVEKLRALHDDPTINRGPFFTYMGQLQDGREQVWNVKGAAPDVPQSPRPHRNGQGVVPA